MEYVFCLTYLVIRLVIYTYIKSDIGTLENPPIVLGEYPLLSCKTSPKFTRIKNRGDRYKYNVLTYKASLILELITLILHQKNKLKKNNQLHFYRHVLQVLNFYLGL